MNRCLSLSSVAFLSILAASALPARAQSSAVLERSSHFVSAPSLPLSGAPTAIVSGDINNDGKLDLITADAASGKVTVSLGLGNGEFAAGVSFSAGDHPSALLLANLGNGGHLDLVVANAAAISVLSGNGDGSFQAPVAYPLSFRPALLAAGNFRGQGRADLIVTDAASAHIALLANDGQGRYAAPATQSVRAIPSALAVIPGASHADLALAYADGSVNILHGGAATLAAGSTIALANGPISALLAGDFNRDGNPDLAATIPGKQQLSVLLGSGDGHFAAPANYRVSSNPQSILAADFDDDGVSDLIVANQGSNTFSLLHGNADGSFLAASDFVTGRGPIAAVAGDFDQDGHLDLALLNRDDATISIPRGTGSGSFAAARAYSVNQQPRSVAVADLTGSHRADLIVTSDCSSASSCTHGAASVLLAQEDGSYHLAASYPLGAAPVALALANLDGGKIPSILALNRADKTLSILPGLGNGAFQQQPITLSLPTSPIAFAIADLNHDGRPDLAILGDCGSDSCSQPGALAIFYGSASGFRSGPTYPLGYAPSSVAIADLNGDKQLDILVANRCGTSAACAASGTGSIFFGAAEERFTAGPSIDLGSSPSSIALADLGSRGAQDLIVTHAADNSITTLSGNGDGSFQPAVRYAAGATPNSIAVADFNGDGHLDVAVSNHTDATVSVFYGKGGGALASQSTLAVGAGPASLATLSASSRTHAGLVTANADASTPGAGDQVTILANLHPDALGTNSSTTTIVASPTSATVGGGVTLTATVTGDATNGAPTGSVSFVSTPDAISDCNGSTSNAVTPGTAGSTSTTFVCLTHALQAPSQTVAADYSGDNNYDVSSTNAASDATVTVAPYTTASLALSPSSSSTTVGSSVTFTASLTGLPTSGPTTSGTVHFKINGVTDATTCPDEPISGTPACTTTTLTVGHGTVTATYSGDSNYTVSNTATSTVTVAANTSATLALTPSSSSIALGSSVTFTASLTGLPTGGPAASGTVHFLINGVANATACPDELISGTPVCTTNTLTVGHGTVTATYSADTNYTVSNTATSTVTVTPDTSATLALTPSASSVTLGSAVTFTASLTGLPSGGPAASGTVHFLINGVADTVTCPDKLISGTPTCTTNTLTVGHGTVTATYSGDSNYTVSNTATSTVTVAANTSATLALTPSSSSIALGSSVTFTASL
ncbi:MAG TPA: FG-GAP-like repeat-containing protein, partial [Acidobacteriaceae bacterium]|nr:FG-GAP-like repeat-containing protein [Acidobacteriaceae bacterium]